MKTLCSAGITLKVWVYVCVRKKIVRCDAEVYIKNLWMNRKDHGRSSVSLVFPQSG